MRIEAKTIEFLVYSSYAQLPDFLGFGGLKSSVNLDFQSLTNLCNFSAELLSHLEIEGDELYTKVHKYKPPSESQGWTIVLMERGRRFLWELHCGRKERQLFEQALLCLTQVMENT